MRKINVKTKDVIVEDNRTKKVNSKKYPKEEIDLFQWADISDEQIAELAALAQPEVWNYDGNDMDSQYPMLCDYLANTFTRIVREKKMSIGIYSYSEKDAKRGVGEDYAIFNTGLVNRNHMYIYAGFKSYKDGEAEGKPYWHLLGFFTEDNRYEVLKFHFKLPDKADYIQHNMENIYLDVLNSSFVFYLGDKTDEYEDVYWRSVRSVDANYTSAVPMYDVSDDTMGFVIPFERYHDGEVNCALVVKKDKTMEGIEKVYMATEIISLKEAYLNCRMVKKVESEWLTL